MSLFICAKCGCIDNTATFCTYETEEVPENGVEWGNCMVQDFIDFKRKGIIPEHYKKSHQEWLDNSKSTNS